MHNGTIVSLRLDKGFGFIFTKTGEPDVFFHCKELSDDLPFDEQLHERSGRRSILSIAHGVCER